ncbi:DUF2760 domain-containing protein [Trichloromonas sp.]|uniref:DUF2760 domain-containing protein n=1 Tax=Trichloromonas sp. TaxID=3069249 RepID=UPI002A440D1B|nr:DUF2760 domain-containing protein [Trichloromonas sp.]
MSILFTLTGLALVAVLFFFPEQFPPHPELLSQLHIAAVALLGIAALLQLVGLFRRKPAAVEAPAVKAPAPEPVAPRPAPEKLAQAQVVRFLGQLQEKGRLVDFAMDDITPYSNEEIGAAARVVHQGCKEVLAETFDIRALHPGSEGEDLTLAADFDARAYRLVGKVPEHPPFTGRVLHRGWKTARVNLPQLTDEAREVIAPAEVEIA